MRTIHSGAPVPADARRTGSPRRRRIRCLLACGALASGLLAAAAPALASDPQPTAAAPAPLGGLLADARRLLAGGDAPAAHALLAAQTRWYAGSPDFDHLLGLAALDAGQPGQAVLAFERVLAVDPGHLQARAELARALLATRETEAARRELESVSAQRIPAEVRAVIDQYLAAIAVAERAGRTSFQGRAEIGAGWDSNVTLGSIGSQWLLAGGVAVVPEPSSRPRSAALIAWGAGLDWQGPIGGGWHWTVGAQAIGRSNASAHTLDQTYFDLSGGLRYRTGCHGFDMLAQLQHLRADQSAFRNAVGVVGQWRCDLDARTQVGLYVQHFDFRFPDQPIRDARRQIVGATAARSFAGDAAPLLAASLYAGRERPDAPVPQLEHDILGARGVLSLGVSPRARAWASVSWEARDFAGAEPLFGTVREDRQTEVEFGAAIRVNRSWVLLPRLVHTRNASSLAPSDFRRTQALVTARYGF